MMMADGHLVAAVEDVTDKGASVTISLGAGCRARSVAASGVGGWCSGCAAWQCTPWNRHCSAWRKDYFYHGFQVPNQVIVTIMSASVQGCVLCYSNVDVHVDNA